MYRCIKGIVIVGIVLLCGCSAPETAEETDYPTPVIPMFQLDNTEPDEEKIALPDSLDRSDLEETNPDESDGESSAALEANPERENIPDFYTVGKSDVVLIAPGLELYLDILSLFDKSLSDVIAEYGEIEEVGWRSGYIFKHTNCKYWFAYKTDYSSPEDCYEYKGFQYTNDSPVKGLYCWVTDAFFSFSEDAYADISTLCEDVSDGYGDSLLFEFRNYKNIDFHIFYNKDEQIDGSSLVLIMLK